MIMLKIIGSILYLIAGWVLFKAAVRNIGGKEVYMERLSSTSRLRSELAYYFCGAIIAILWPWVIIISIMKKEDEE